MLEPQERLRSVIAAKPINELTDDERKTIIDNARAGIENPYYDVKLFKNGNTRICKKKRKTMAQQLGSPEGLALRAPISPNGEVQASSRSGDQKVYMTDNQLLWQHVLDLQDKYHNLYRKHKKLKSRYNDLYIEDEQPTTQQVLQEQPQEQQPQRPTGSSLQRGEQPQQPQQQQQQQQPQQPNAYEGDGIPPMPNLIHGGWRSRLQQKNLYVS
jgi:transcription initiation factor TFIID subunit TAF12